MQDSPINRLPQELFDAILDIFHCSQDIQSLRECALTARCFLPSTRRLIFRTIHLQDILSEDGRAKNTEQFEKLLKSSPHLAEYMTELILDIQGKIHRFDERKLPLPFILSRLENLEKITMGKNWMFPALSAALLDALLDAIIAPRIRAIVMDRLDFNNIADLIAFCEWTAGSSGIQELSFRHFRTPDRRPADRVLTRLPRRAAAPTPLNLRTFAVTHKAEEVKAILEWATSSRSCLRFTDLRSLTLGDLTEASFIHLLRILDAAKDTLTHLHLLGNLPLSLPPLSLTSARHLRTITCSLSLDDRSTLNRWCTALHQTEELKLDSFTVLVDPGLTSRTMTLSDVFVQHPWKEFEAALFTRTQCRRLEMKVGPMGTPLSTNVIKDCFPLAHADSQGTGNELVIMQRINSLEVLEEREYRSRFGV
ncbi:hypothetical protein VNI00_004243 [Paramarasmius palmivorus]|uniref:F-box domain-containing protein n=1 Tax=Paramarasmius palmivorus TaxID=297713 RepID=A0AAW0DNW8_9AGAR